MVLAAAVFGNTNCSAAQQISANLLLVEISPARLELHPIPFVVQ